MYIPPVNDITRALILALNVCYHARLKERREYVDGVVQQFKSPLGIPGGAKQFCNEIKWYVDQNKIQDVIFLLYRCQYVLLDNMKLGQNIAKNAALRENVFMMAICIELRIPLFLVGKPGSSKSLAKSIVADSMLGKASEKPLMKTFKEVCRYLHFEPSYNIPVRSTCSPINAVSCLLLKVLLKFLTQQKVFKKNKTQQSMYQL